MRRTDLDAEYVLNYSLTNHFKKEFPPVNIVGLVLTTIDPLFHPLIVAKSEWFQVSCNKSRWSLDEQALNSLNSENQNREGS